MLWSLKTDLLIKENIRKQKDDINDIVDALKNSSLLSEKDKNEIIEYFEDKKFSVYCQEIAQREQNISFLLPTCWSKKRPKLLD